MTTINEYLSNLTGIRAERVGAVVEFIRTKYPNAVEGVYIAPNTQMPTFEIDKKGVSIGNTKSYISIYFSNFDAPQMLVKSNPKIKAGKSCVNIRDSVDFPMEDIKKAIDFCMANEEQSNLQN